MQGAAVTVGLTAGLAAAALALRLWNPLYVPYDGMVGLPAFLDYPPQKKIIGYLLIVLLPAATAIAARAAAERWNESRGEALPRRVPLFMTGSVVASIVLLGAAVALLPEFVNRELRLIASDPAAGIYVLAVAGVAIWLANRPRGDRPGIGGRAGAGRAGAWIAVFGCVALYTWTMGTFCAARPWQWVLVVALGGLGVWVLRPMKVAGRDRSLRGEAGGPESEAAETEAARAAWNRGIGVRRFGAAVGWAVLIALPLVPIAWRWWATFDPPEEALRALRWGCMAAFGVGLGLVWLGRERESGGGVCGTSFFRAGAVWLLPTTVAALYRGAGTLVYTYDAFHQGEYVYPWHAVSAGLAPYRDVFFVHGIGFNLIAGWAVGDLLPHAPNFDLFFLSLIATGAVALMTWFYLDLFGRRWWLLALTLGALTAGAAALKGGRFLPLYAMLFLLACGLKSAAAVGTPRLRAFWWGVGGGLAGSVAVAYSLDIGALAVMGGGLWAVGGVTGAAFAGHVARARGATEGTGGGESGGAGAGLWPVHLGFMAGGLAGGMVFLGWLAAEGLLEEFLVLHLDYAAMKAHFDNLPLPTRGLAYLLGPALTVTGLLFLTSRRARHEEKLGFPARVNVGAEQADAGAERAQFGQVGFGESGTAPLPVLRSLIALLTLLNIIAFMRGLDRSDPGHLVYANELAWPLLACLIVWRASHAGWGAALGRSAAVAALLALLPFTPEPVRGEVLPVVPAHRIFIQYRDYIHRPAMPSYEETAPEFFALSERVGQATEPGQTMFDLSSQPALYFWNDLYAPTRFFFHYATSMQWQGEVIEALERDETPWVVWPGPEHFGATFDNLPIELRMWRVTRYVRRHYEPAVALPGGGVLMRRGGVEGPPPEPQAAIPRVALPMGAVPEVWGRSAEGAPPLPEELLAETAWLPGAAGSVTIFSDSAQAPEMEAEELQVEVRGAASGTIHMELMATARRHREGEEPGRSISFRLSPDFAGPYRIPLSSFGVWPLTEDRGIRVEWRVESGATGPPEAVRFRLFR